MKTHLINILVAITIGVVASIVVDTKEAVFYSLIPLPWKWWLLVITSNIWHGVGQLQGGC